MDTARIGYETVATCDQLWIVDGNGFSPTGIFIVVKGDAMSSVQAKYL